MKNKCAITLHINNKHALGGHITEDLITLITSFKFL